MISEYKKLQEALIKNKELKDQVLQQAAELKHSQDWSNN